jgi:trimethylamine:corrinoid methyltransferase-like protein
MSIPSQRPDPASVGVAEGVTQVAMEAAASETGVRMAEAVPPALDPPILEALDAFVARRKREIGAGPA